MIILRSLYLLFFNGVGNFIFYLFLLMMFYSLSVGGIRVRILLRMELLRVTLILLTILIFFIIVFLRSGYRYYINNVGEYNLTVFFFINGVSF